MTSSTSISSAPAKPVNPAKSANRLAQLRNTNFGKNQAKNNNDAVQKSPEIPVSELKKLGGSEVKPPHPNSNPDGYDPAVATPIEANNQEVSKKLSNSSPTAAADHSDKMGESDQAVVNLKVQLAESRQQLAECRQQLAESRALESKLRENHQKLLKERQEEQDEHIKSINALGSDLRGQIEKMTHIISQLRSKGLPQAPDDGYLQRTLQSIVHDVMLFARAFTRGQDALTWEMLSRCKIKLDEDTQDYLKGRFLNLEGLVSSQNAGAKVRTRCVQVIMFLGLMLGPLWDRPLGFPKELRDTRENFRKSVRCSDEEFQAWNALTAHLLIKNNPTFIQEQEKEIDDLTDLIYEAIAPWGQFKRVNKGGLKEIVTKVAKFGLELAQLPFGVIPLELNPGSLFDNEEMVDVDEESEEMMDVDGESGEMMDTRSTPHETTIILSYPWAKVTYTEDGSKVYGKNNVLCKAQVSCLK